MKHSLMIISLILVQFSLFAAEHTVKMLNQGPSGVMVFEPAFLKVNIGDSVTFESTDAAHNTASIAGMIPAGASAWNSPLSRDITVKFDIAGVYGYQCTPHSMMAMVGIIQVGEDTSNLVAVKDKAQQFKSAFVMNKTRLDDLIAKI